MPRGRFLAASVGLAAGCGAVIYRLIGVPTPRPEPAPHRPWHVIVLPAWVLDSVDVVSACGLLLLLIWAARRQLDPARALLAGGFALAGALTGAVLQIVSAPAWTPTYAKVAAASVVVAWLGVLGGWRTVMRPRYGTSGTRGRGCTYCSVDLHLVAGDVQQLAVRDDQRAVLLRCPRCGWLYQAAVSEVHFDPEPLTEAQARELYAFP